VQALIHLFLFLGANVNAQATDGETALMEAVAHAKELLVSIILKYKPDLEIRDAMGRTVLYRAAGGATVKSPAAELIVLEKLIKAGADVTTTVVRDPNKAVPLDSRLINIGATPLMSAAARGDADIIRALVNAFEIAQTLLALKELGSPRIEILDIFAPTVVLVDPFALPRLSRINTATVNFVNAKDSSGATALGFAARFGQLDALRALLGWGATADLADDEGFTPLMRVFLPVDPVVKERLLHAARLQIIYLLLEQRAKVSTKVKTLAKAYVKICLKECATNDEEKSEYKELLKALSPSKDSSREPSPTDTDEEGDKFSNLVDAVLDDMASPREPSPSEEEPVEVEVKRRRSWAVRRDSLSTDPRVTRKSSVNVPKEPIAEEEEIAQVAPGSRVRKFALKNLEWLLTKRPTFLFGELHGERTRFRAHAVDKDGDCGFNVLGINRDDAVISLIQNLHNPDIRDMIITEMLNARGEQEDTFENDDEVQRMRAELEQDRTRLEAFVGQTLAGHNWLTFLVGGQLGLLDALAEIHGLEVFIWQDVNVAEGTLALNHHYQPRNHNVVNTIHMRHTDEATHFELLEIVRADEDNEAALDESEDEVESDEDKHQPGHRGIKAALGALFLGVHFAKDTYK